MMTRFLLQRAFWTVAVAVAAVCSSTLTPQQAVSEWTIGDPIVTYFAGPGYVGQVPLTDADAERMVDVGMNLAWAGSAPEVDLAGRHGLRALYQNRTILLSQNVDDPVMRHHLDVTVDELRGKPNLFGYFVADEPSVEAISELKPIVDYLHVRDPNHVAYLTLVPYQDRVDHYAETLNPSLLSYDCYQLAWTGGDQPGYLPSLEMISQKAKAIGVPFMNVVQACGWDLAGSPGTPSMRVPNGDEMRFLAYSTMAYGAQGISYFVWNWPGYEGGVVNTDGTPSPIYSTLKVVNREFVAIAKQYQPLKSIGVYLKGYSPDHLPPGATLLPDDSPFTVSDVSDSRIYTDGARLRGVMLGFFDKDGTALSDATFALVANLNYAASKTYTVTGPGDMSVFDATTGVWTATGHNYVTLDLLPGGGALVGLTSAVPEPSAIVLLGSFLFCLLARAWRKTASVASGLPHR